MSDPSSHPTQEELSAYSLGQLPQERAVAIDSHISECQPCCETIVGLSSDDTFVGLLQEARQLPTDQAVDHRAATASSSVQDVPVPLAEHPRYEIAGLIGKGGMGDVYKARHRKMERTVALKVINRGLVRKTEAIDRFHREVKAAAQLSHPNIVTAYDADQAGEFHFMVMEYVDGVDLSQTVKDRGALPVAEACEYIRQAAIGLQHAHERGMVHRDIKPHNLMVTQDGTVKILDFGLASLAPEAVVDPDIVQTRGDLTAAGAIMGTPDFISPEQATDARQADIRSDIYSLGSTLYFLLSGQPPFADGSVMHKLKSHAHAEPEPLESLRDDVPPELVAVVTKMTAKDPAERYLTPSEVADALESFLRTWRPGEANLQRQDLSGGGNNSGSGGQQPGAGDPNPSRLPMVAKFLLYTSLLPIGLIVVNEFVPLGLFSGETDWFWYCSLTSIALSTISGIVLGVHQGMSNIRDGQRINGMTTGQTALIIICLAVSAFILLNHMSDGKGHIEVTPQSDYMTLGTHPLAVVDTSGERPAGGTSGTRRDDAAGVTTHFFESANGRYNIELSNEVLTVNGEEHSLEGPYDSIRIVDDRVEITRVVSNVSSGPFKVDGKTGVATGHALGIDFVVAGATGVLTSNQLAAGKPGNTSARLEITLADDVIMRLEMLDADGPIFFHLNGIGLGSLTAGDQVAIDDQRKVTVNGIARSDQVAIQGEWRVIFAEDSGRTGPPEAVRDIRVTITQDELTMEIAGRKNVSTFTLDPSTTPKSIDMITEGRTKRGIYDLQGDTLRICFSEATDERPTVFDSQPDSANDVVLTLKRVKPDKDSTATAGDQNRAGPLSPELARSLIPAAASISLEDFQKLQSNPSRDAIQNESLSLILMTLDVRDQSPEAAGDFRFLVEGLPKPSEIAAAMSPSRSKGYYSIIQPDYITECRITDSADDTAQGNVTFNAPQLYIGSATFEARKHKGKWRIEKFRLKSRRISVVLGDDGKWHCEEREAEGFHAPDPSDSTPDETPEPSMSTAADVESLPLVQVLHDAEGLTEKRVKIIGTLLVTDNKSGVSSYQISTAKEALPPRPNKDAYSDREVTFEASFDEEKIINVGQFHNKRVLATGLIYYFPADSESPVEVRFMMDDICEYRPQANANEEAPKAFLKKAKRLEEQGDFASAADAYLAAYRLAPRMFHEDHLPTIVNARRTGELVELFTVAQTRSFFSYVADHVLRKLLANESTRSAGNDLLRNLWEIKASTNALSPHHLLTSKPDEIWTYVPNPEYYLRSRLIPDNIPSEGAGWGRFKIEGVYELSEEPGWGYPLSLRTLLKDKAVVRKVAEEVEAKVEQHPDWKSGRAVLALLEANAGNYGKATELIGQVLADAKSGPVPSDSAFVFGMSLEGMNSELDQQVMQLYESSLKNRPPRVYRASAIPKLGRLYAKYGKREEARQALYRLTDVDYDPSGSAVICTPGRRPQNHGRCIECHSGKSNLIDVVVMANNLTDIGYPVDAFISLSRIDQSFRNAYCSDDAWAKSTIPEDFYSEIERGRTKFVPAKRKAEDQITSELVLQSLKSGAFANNYNGSQAQEGASITIDLMPSARGENGKSTLFSPVVDALKRAISSKGDKAALANVQIDQLLSEEFHKNPEDMEIGIAATLFAFLRNNLDDAEERCRELAKLVRFKQLQEDDIALWLVARVALKHESTKVFGDELTSRALAAAEKQSNPLWKEALSRELAEAFPDHRR